MVYPVGLLYPCADLCMDELPDSKTMKNEVLLLAKCGALKLLFFYSVTSCGSLGQNISVNASLVLSAQIGKTDSLQKTAAPVLSIPNSFLYLKLVQ